MIKSTSRLSIYTENKKKLLTEDIFVDESHLEFIKQFQKFFKLLIRTFLMDEIVTSYLDITDFLDPPFYDCIEEVYDLSLPNVVNSVLKEAYTEFLQNYQKELDLYQIFYKIQVYD